QMQVRAIAFGKDGEKPIDPVRSDRLGLESPDLDGLLVTDGRGRRPAGIAAHACGSSSARKSSKDSFRWARLYASRGSMMPSFNRFISAVSISIMPEAPPVCIAVGIWKVFPSRIRPATLDVLRRTSKAATRPEP